MADSERAAELARGTDLEVGLHLNLTEDFTGSGAARELQQEHAKVAKYLNGSRFATALYNPLLSSAFRNVVQQQQSEFKRLYGRPPGFVNGHHHMHLSANVLGQGLLPVKARIRGPFTFRAGEKSSMKRWYRGWLAQRVRRNFITPDCLYNVEPIHDTERLRRIAQEAQSRTVELEVHPEHAEQREFLLSPEFRQIVQGTELQGFGQLSGETSNR
jgi:predicted glycoside hydrolase/deacetylase ChbG (UPF0249 family)